MSEIPATTPLAAGGATARPQRRDIGIKRRYAAEARFRAYGMAAVGVAVLALVFLLVSILANGLGAFRQTFVTFDVTLDAAVLDKVGNRDPEEMKKVTTIGYGNLLKAALGTALDAAGVSTDGVSAKDVGGLLSKEAPAQLRNRVLADPGLLGTTISFRTYANGRIDGYFKGRVTMQSAALDSNVSPQQLELADRMREAGMIGVGFNTGFLFGPDASELRPEAAGLGIAILGSAYMMILVLLLSLPFGVAASIYLEEFAPQNRFTDLIEVNINNLAAVPSIVFGLLGLAIFINFMGLPQSASVVGALVLALMTLPTIIIATRAAL
ncbi:MAG: DUF3333 domain-containing protein, partial [Rhodobiaceae bacterium]|nr:DUF3333 domain-containing protein [Rhodobiaceae bacterium]